jgi:hypothetical protein
MSGGKILDKIEIDLKNRSNNTLLKIYIDIFDNSLSRKWLLALDHLLENNYHLEKNYCFFGFVDSTRNGSYILDQVNRSIDAINRSDIDYHINDRFDMSNTITDDPIGTRMAGRNIIQDRMNMLHRYFEDLQGTAQDPSPLYHRADPATRWHIRQLNLLCHEFESWALSYRKQIEAPEWQRPSQLMCWLNAPRYELDEQDFELFGIETLNRSLGGVFVGVNKAVGKHHWEVFNDEGRDVSELISTSMRGQTLASGDFDIEWGRDPGEFRWQQKRLAEFCEWLTSNNFDPNDPSLTIGHPQIGQVDLGKSFGNTDFWYIWKCLADHLDVYSVKTSQQQSVYDYHWSDIDYQQRQISLVEENKRWYG